MLRRSALVLAAAILSLGSTATSWAGPIVDYSVDFTAKDDYGDTATVSGTVSADTTTSTITGSSLTFSLVSSMTKSTPFSSETLTLPTLPTFYGDVTVHATPTELTFSPTDPGPGNEAVLYWRVPSPNTIFTLFGYSSFQSPAETSTSITYYDLSGHNGRGLLYNYSTTTDSISLMAVPSAVPEPSSLALIATAVASFTGYFGRRRQGNPIAV